MASEIMDPDQEYDISPEALEIAKTYLQCQDIKETASILGIVPERVSYYVKKPEVQRFIDHIFLDQGYMNRSRIQDVMDTIIDLKIEEINESEIGSSKDIADLLKMQHDMRMAEIKASQSKDSIRNQVNVQQNNNGSFGTNYDDLLGKIFNAGK